MNFLGFFFEISATYIEIVSRDCHKIPSIVRAYRLPWFVGTNFHRLTPIFVPGIFSVFVQNLFTVASQFFQNCFEIFRKFERIFK